MKQRYLQQVLQQITLRGLYQTSREFQFLLKPILFFGNIKFLIMANTILKQKYDIGIAADHGGYELKVQITAALKSAGYKVVDFGAHELVSGDDYPDFVIPLARAVANGDVSRGLAICGSGVGACVAANKMSGVRAALITDSFSAHQGCLLYTSPSPRD